MQGIAELGCNLNHSGMPKAPRTTDNPFGRKLLDVLAEKGHADDLNVLANAFGVKLPSVYDWVNHGRFAKERYADLVSWSNRSLHWWFDIPADSSRHEAREPSAPYAVGWPFPNIRQSDVCKLELPARLQLEAALLGAAAALRLPLKAKAS